MEFKDQLMLFFQFFNLKIMKVCIVYVFVLTISSILSEKNEDDEHWKAFMRDHNSRRARSVTQKDKSKFLKCKKLVEKHNKKFDSGEVDFTTTVNLYSVKGTPQTCSNCDPVDPKNIVKSSGYKKNLPESVDWRSKGVISPVQDQNADYKQCGSCWAFSAIGAVEARYAIKFNKPVPNLSEQELVDCPHGNYSTFACRGGRVESAYRYIKDKGGLILEQDYPYEAEQDKCHINPKKKFSLIIAYYDDIPPGDEEELKSVVAEHGPVSVSIDASHTDFTNYHKGVYYQKNCSPTNVTHAVLVVGYGTEERGGDYWLVKNSWGSHWGDNGYIKMSRNRKNNCGIASFAIFPELSEKKHDSANENLIEKDQATVAQAKRVPKVSLCKSKVNRPCKKNHRRCFRKN